MAALRVGTGREDRATILGTIILTKYGKFDIVHKDNERGIGWRRERGCIQAEFPRRLLTDPGVNDLIKPPG
uniref:HDC05126 n=1 Tax=Drosophila melanogaster TaxID=7227 RepID=Q6IGV1_DROME|nr:TPA_inf: HDC05126 [Drosophila melanogaster]